MEKGTRLCTASLSNHIVIEILKYASYTIRHGKIVRDYGFLERMLQFQRNNISPVNSSSVTRLLFANEHLLVEVTHNVNGEHPYYYFEVQNKTKNKSRCDRWEQFPGCAYRKTACVK
jgi:hypothetical protein